MVSSTNERGYVPIGSHIMMTEAYHCDTKDGSWWWCACGRMMRSIITVEKNRHLMTTDLTFWYLSSWRIDVCHLRQWFSAVKFHLVDTIYTYLYHGFTLPSVARVAMFFFRFCKSRLNSVWLRKTKFQNDLNNLDVRIWNDFHPNFSGLSTNMLHPVWRHQVGCLVPWGWCPAWVAAWVAVAACRAIQCRAVAIQCRAVAWVECQAHLWEWYNLGRRRGYILNRPATPPSNSGIFLTLSPYRQVLPVLGVDPTVAPPSVARFIRIPYLKCNSPGGDCYWVRLLTPCMSKIAWSSEAKWKKVAVTGWGGVNPRYDIYISIQVHAVKLRFL